MSTSEEASEPTVEALYFNGLGNGKTRKREQTAFDFLAKHNIYLTHAHIDWYAKESLNDLLADTTERAKEILKQKGKLVLVGSSAGGSLAVNVMSKLHDRRLFAVTLSSRLHEAELPSWDRRTLERVAYIGTPKESKRFFDSVTYCGQVAIPKLTKSDKRRIITVQQWTDTVVPRQTMGIPGVITFKVPGIGHSMGIATATRRLPKIIRSLS